MNWKVPLFDLDIGKQEIEAISQVIQAKWISMGQVTKEFEKQFAERHGAKHGIAVCNCTAALHLALRALGAGRGDEVICPSLTFVATANSILYTGAIPVFADVTDKDDLNISPDDIESKINEKTKAILVVHYAGFPCDMDRIMEIAQKYNLFVIEDAAHAPGAEYSSQLTADGSQLIMKKGNPVSYELSAMSWPSNPINPNNSSNSTNWANVGSIGDIGCFSFFSNKNMTTAEGGMVVTNRDDLAEKIRIARSHGMTSLTWDRHMGRDFSYDVVGPGFSYRLDELRSSLGLVQLKKLDRNNRRRRSLCTLYREKLKSIEEIKVPFSHFSGISSYHIFPILLSEKIDRRGFMEYLREQGIQTSIHYPPVHLFSYYKKLMPSDAHLPLTEYVGRREVTLPLFPTMEEQQIEYVVNAIKSYLAQNRETILFIPKTTS